MISTKIKSSDGEWLSVIVNRSGTVIDQRDETDLVTSPSAAQTLGTTELPQLKKNKSIEHRNWRSLLSPHIHSSPLAMQSANDRTLIALGRWKSPAMLSRYAHLSPTHLWKAVEGLTGYGKTILKPLEVGELKHVGRQRDVPAGCSKWPSSKAAASEEARRTLRYVEPLSAARTMLADFFSILLTQVGAVAEE